jgi:hypothetical protein
VLVSSAQLMPAGAELDKIGTVPKLCRPRKRDGALNEGWERWEAWLPASLLYQLRKSNRVERGFHTILCGKEVGSFA